KELFSAFKQLLALLRRCLLMHKLLSKLIKCCQAIVKHNLYSCMRTVSKKEEEIYILVFLIRQKISLLINYVYRTNCFILSAVNSLLAGKRIGLSSASSLNSNSTGKSSFFTLKRSARSLFSIS